MKNSQNQTDLQKMAEELIKTAQNEFDDGAYKLSDADIANVLNFIPTASSLDIYGNIDTELNKLNIADNDLTNIFNSINNSVNFTTKDYFTQISNYYINTLNYKSETINFCITLLDNVYYNNPTLNINNLYHLFKMFILLVPRNHTLKITGIASDLIIKKHFKDLRDNERAKKDSDFTSMMEFYGVGALIFILMILGIRER